jgi:hypothetical protein
LPWILLLRVSVGLVDFATIWNCLNFHAGRDLGLLLAVQTTANQADKDWEGSWARQRKHFAARSGAKPSCGKPSRVGAFTDSAV